MEKTKLKLLRRSLRYCHSLLKAGTIRIMNL